MSSYDQPNQPWGAAQWTRPPQATETSGLRGLSTALTVLFAVTCGGSVLIVIALLRRVAFIDGILDGTADPARADSVDGFVGVAYLLWGLVALAIVPVFLVWQYRHAKNARVLGSTTWGPGWAIGGWFIPIANLFLPARQLWVSSKFSDARQQGAGIVIAWWLTLLVGGAAVRASTINDDTYTINELRDSDIAGVVSEVLSIAAAVLAIAMVRGLTSRQESRLAERLSLIGGQAQPYGSWPAAPPGSPYGQAPYGQAPYGQPGPAQPSYGQPSYGPPPSPYDQPPAGDPYAQPSSPPSATPAGWSPQQPAQPDQSVPPSPFAQRAGATPDEPAPSDPDAPQGPPAPPPVPPS